ncbi:hypothetical protein [Bdellovibrio svalbardensis]|uniref:Uncharacterized protein n=1 Tax=Bdellovibrio svalbardensis TaxID=2972972 RepID=A0ABT6DHC5_9BACT|nr:hypothetical protein [Bdellovibrio svalbardensis]MDG0816266.1 hypothetical protein [Bdellovibrio svalbardensis]
MTTVRVRSMSISTADAEKLCAEDSNEVVNCAVTKLQGPHSGGINESVKACRSEWGLASPTPTPAPTTSPAASPSTIKVPTEMPKTDDHESNKTDGKTEPKGNFEEI